MISTANKINLLSKNVWSYRDIMDYFGVSKPTAIKAKNTAIKCYGGKVSYGSNFAKIDSVLELYSTNRLTEIKKLKEMMSEETKSLSKVNIDFDAEV